MARCTAPLPATIRRSSRTSTITALVEAPTAQRSRKLMIRQLDDRTLVSGQIAPHEVAGLAEQGGTVLVNNRPDGEEDGQPFASDIEEAAAQAGIAYHFVPIIRGIGPADVEEMQQALREAADGKLLAFCRSGRRS